MDQEKLFASFTLDKQQEMAIALHAEYVAEATKIQGNIQKLPGGIEFLEGFMQLREEVLPVINLKKRLGMEEVSYHPDAKVAVVDHMNLRYGLLFEDIREVFRVGREKIVPIHPSLRSKDHVIAALIQPGQGQKAVELLDLNALMAFDQEKMLFGDDEKNEGLGKEKVEYFRYVTIACAGQEYGIPVEYTREITFCKDIDEMFSSGSISGAIELRGRTIAVMDTRILLNAGNTDGERGEATRIVILASDDCVVGLITDEVRQILTVAEKEILPFPGGTNDNVKGIISRSSGGDIILLNVENLICQHMDAVKSMAKIGNGHKGEDEDLDTARRSSTHHLITENSYLVFSIGKNFAIELKDVREILENTSPMRVPGATGFSTEVINLRGKIVPVVNLRCFYGYEEPVRREGNRLIICSANEMTVALEVDRIETIYKQEQFFSTPSLSRQLAGRKDTLDRLIEYRKEGQLNEHVLVLNIYSLIRNYFQVEGKGDFAGGCELEGKDDMAEIATKEG